MRPPPKPQSLESRLLRIMVESGFRSIRGLTEGCGLAPATLAKRIQKERESGSAKIDGHTLQRISQKTGFNAHWIITGEGSPYISAPHSGDPSSGLPHPDDAVGPEAASWAGRSVVPRASRGFSPAEGGGWGADRPAAGGGARAAGHSSIEWGREVVAGLVRQGIPAIRARQAVGALLLEANRDYSSVLELYQASLERLGYTHVAPTQEFPSETTRRSGALSQRSARRKANAARKERSSRARSGQGKP